VKAFNSSYSVSSYRFAKLSDAFYREKSAIEQLLNRRRDSSTMQSADLDGECSFFTSISGDSF